MLVTLSSGQFTMAICMGLGKSSEKCKSVFVVGACYWYVMNSSEAMWRTDMIPLINA